jgi:hypothetical protein
MSKSEALEPLGESSCSVDATESHNTVFAYGKGRCTVKTGVSLAEWLMKPDDHVHVSVTREQAAGKAFAAPRL